MNTLLKTTVIIALFSVPLISQARLLQIIHTNDLHSYFKGYRDGRGGYARLKTRIEQLREESRARGIEVLQLDGGDFGEGTSFFMSQEGSASVKALGLLGAEISVIGNHDHLMGANTLGRQIRQASINTQFLSANLVHTPEMQLGDILKPYVDFERAGIKIRVIGLSTAEIHYQYALKPGIIKPAVPVGVTHSTQGRKEGRELIIALTHIGQKKDVELARESSDIDLIVGGHSHDFIENVRWEKNKKQKQVPIVQAGAHGLVVGTLLIDLKDNGSLQVINYKLHKIVDPIEEDGDMVNFVAVAADNRNQYFGDRWDEVIGESLVPLSGYQDGRPSLTESCWGRHMAKMTKDASGATLAIHLADFEGEQIPAGQITYGDMIDNFPHIRNYGDPGWEISTIHVKGSILKTLLGAIINLKDSKGISFNGITYKSIRVPSFIPYLGGKVFPYSMRTSSGAINNKGDYTVAFPSEVAYALKESLPNVTKVLFPSLKNTGKYYWKVMEEYIRNNSPISCR